MAIHDSGMFTVKEINRLKIIQDVVDRRLTTQMAAQRLGIYRRLLSRYREHGPLGMANHRGILMTAHVAEFFTLDEVNRLKIIQDVIDRRLTTQMAALRLGISDRQCRRLLSRYRENGPLRMTNRRRGKASNNQLPQGLAVYALNIIRERYTDFGPTLASEKLAELHDVHLSKETVWPLMVKASNNEHQRFSSHAVVVPAAAN